MIASKKDFEQLSAYVDGELSESQIIELEKKISSSLELQKKLEELKKLKQLTSSIKRIPESQYFETRIMAELEDIKSKNFLVRWSPAISIAALIIAVMALLRFNPDFFDSIWEQQKSNIAGFYKENLQPLLFTADLTNEDIFNFAFNKELPLDNDRNQFLRLGYDANGKEYFEIKSAGFISKKNEYSNFIKALNLSDDQKLKVDSVIGKYAEALESQILVNENKTVAINPKLWNFRKALAADLLVLAQDLNREKFNKVVPVSFSNNDRMRIVNAVNTLYSVDENNYIFCTPDSIFTANFEFKSADFKNRVKDVELKINNVNKREKDIDYGFNYDSSWQKYRDADKWAHNFEIRIDSNICRVVIPRIEISDFQIPDFDSINAIIDEATRQVQFYSFKIPKIEHLNHGLKIEYYDVDSIQTYEYKFENYDSLLRSNYMHFDSLDYLYKDKFMHWNDSMAMKFDFDFDQNFRDFNHEELEKEMQSLKQEMKEFREEMQRLNESLKEEKRKR